MINFANPENVPKLQALVTACDNSSNSHFLDVPLGVSMITDILFTSPILGGDDAGATGAAGAGQFSEYGGINPDLDPDLAMALKVSMEEAKAKQKAEEPKPATGD